MRPYNGADLKSRSLRGAEGDVAIRTPFQTRNTLPYDIQYIGYAGAAVSSLFTIAPPLSVSLSADSSPQWGEPLKGKKEAPRGVLLFCLAYIKSDS